MSKNWLLIVLNIRWQIILLIFKKCKELFYDREISSNKQVVANMLTTLFSSIYSTDNGNDYDNLFDIFNSDLPNNAYLFLDNVLKGLLVLKGHWTVGPDGLWLLKEFW